jgi:hypothetical protein
MLRIILALLLSVTLAQAADAPAAPHTEPFIGRTATLPLITGGKAAGNLDLAFGAAGLESKWLAGHGFAKVPFTAQAKTQNTSTSWAVTANVTNEKGDQLMLSITLRGDAFTADGNLSVIKKSGDVQTFTFKGKTGTAADAKKKK